MSHVRAQIRAAIAPVLQAALPTHQVFKSRRFKVNESELPIIDMHFDNENVTNEVMGPVIERKASLYIRVSRSANENDVDDDLDADAVAVEVAMDTTIVLDALITYGELVQTNFTGGAAGESVVADVVLRYDISYRTTGADPETAED